MQQLLRNKFILVILGLIGIISIGAIILNAANVTNQTKEPSLGQEPTLTVTSGPVPTSPPEKPVEQLIVVKFKAGTSQATITQTIKKYNATVTKQINGINLTVLKVAPGQEDSVVAKLTQEPTVERVRREFPTHTQVTPNDPNYRLQWYLQNDGNLTINGVTSVVGADIKVEKAWDVTKGSGVKVAIIDTGIDATHPDLAGKVAAQKAFGFADTKDNQGHGTHVAGIIAATSNNSVGISGVCPECQLIVAKALDANSAGAGVGKSEDAIDAIVWAADQGAKVINMSFGTRTAKVAQDYADAVNYAIGKGAVVVAASGNDGNNSPFYPAASDNVVSVAATNNADKKASFSNYGNWVKVAAPGVAIFSTLPTYPHARSLLEGGKLSYDFASGTSMASPVVSGVAALVWSTQYGTSNTSVMNRIYTTAEKIEGTGTYWVNGRVNAQAAVGTATTVPTGTIIPTLYCVGGAAQAPCATVPPTKQPTQAPAAIVNPTQGTENPTPTTATDPCVASQILGTADTPDAAVYTTTDKHQSGGGFFKQLFDFIFRLFEMLFKLIGGTTPTNPGTPVPTATPTTIPAPCPSITQTPQITETPTQAPTETPIPTPTIEPTATAAPTEIPTATEAPTIAVTETPTITAAPTTDPCNDAQTSTASKKHEKGSADKEGFFAKFFAELLKLLQQLLDAIAGKQPQENPSTPDPTPIPCP